jgi:hypothetical protein
MNINVYYNFIEERLHLLAVRITTGGKLNMLSLHTHSEDFYLHFFNLLFNFKLKNLNQTQQNVEAIDLVDHDNKIVIQVSSTNTKKKIDSSLEKEIMKKYSTYTFKFISIAKDASNLRSIIYENPHQINFNPSEDIYDIVIILKKILSENIDNLKLLYEFIKKELGNEVDPVKLDSNLATIINILAKEKWDDANKQDPINSFQIDRKITFNDLNSAKGLIEEFSSFGGKVNIKYSEYDSLGYNKSNSVLATIKREYLKLKNRFFCFPSRTK